MVTVTVTCPQVSFPLSKLNLPDTLFALQERSGAAGDYLPNEPKDTGVRHGDGSGAETKTNVDDTKTGFEESASASSGSKHKQNNPADAFLPTPPSPDTPVRLPLGQRECENENDAIPPKHPDTSVEAPPPTPPPSDSEEDGLPRLSLPPPAEDEDKPPEKPIVVDTRTHYEILGVASNVKDGDLRKAYLTRSRQCHPDKQGGSMDSTLEFQKLNNAYEVLSNSCKRFEYDLTLANPFKGKVSTAAKAKPKARGRPKGKPKAAAATASPKAKASTKAKSTPKQKAKAKASTSKSKAGSPGPSSPKTPKSPKTPSQKTRKRKVKTPPDPRSNFEVLHLGFGTFGI